MAHFTELEPRANISMLVVIRHLVFIFEEGN